MNDSKNKVIKETFTIINLQHRKGIKLEVYHHFSGLSFIEEVNFWRPLKTVVSCDLFIIIIIVFIINFFRRVFSGYTEANVTSLIPLYTILPELTSAMKLRP